MFAQDELLTTRLEILMENHESLKQDYASLERRFKLVEDMNVTMKSHLQNQSQTKELEATNLRLLKDLESETSEKDKYKKMTEEMKRMESDSQSDKDKYKKMIEEMEGESKSEKDKYEKMLGEMKRKESESKAMIDDLRIKNDELLTVIEKEEEEKKKMEDKYNELAERFGEIEKECSHFKSLYDDAKKLIGQRGNTMAFDNEVIVVDEIHNVNDEVIVVDKFHNVSNTLADAIVISDDESDGERDNLPRESNMIPQLPVGIKQEEQCSNGANSSQVKHPSSQVNHWPSPTLSSTSSSSDEYLVQLPFKRSWDDYNKS